MRKTFILLFSIISVLYLTNCKNNVKDEKSLSTTISVDSLLSTPENWLNKEVTISGTVSHVCKHSGKKLFLFGQNPDKTIKINAGGNAASFDISYEGSDVEVKGKLIEDDKIDAEYLNEWEAEIKANLGEEKQKVCEADKKAVSSQTSESSEEKIVSEDPFAKVKEYRKKLAESGRTYIPIYAVDCITITKIKK